MVLTDAEANLINESAPANYMTKLGTLIQSLQSGVAAGEVVFPITPVAGNDLEMDAVSGKDVIVKLSDASAARKLIIKDSGSAVVASVDSDGKALFTAINLVDAGTLKIGGLISTRDAADDSMYIPVANTTAGTERGMKVCYAPGANGGGYFESLYANTKVNASMAGTVRAAEFKTSVTGTANSSGETTALLAKLDVEAGATIASGIGLDVMVDNETSGTVTKAVGLRVQSGGTLNSEVIHNAIDVSGNYKNGAIKMPFATASSSGAPSLAQCVTAFGAAANKGPSTTAVKIGYWKDSGASGHLWEVSAYNGGYFAVDCGVALS